MLCFNTVMWNLLSTYEIERAAPSVTTMGMDVHVHELAPAAEKVPVGQLTQEAGHVVA